MKIHALALGMSLFTIVSVNADQFLTRDTQDSEFKDILVCKTKPIVQRNGWYTTGKISMNHRGEYRFNAVESTGGAVSVELYEKAKITLYVDTKNPKSFAFAAKIPFSDAEYPNETQEEGSLFYNNPDALNEIWSGYVVQYPTGLSRGTNVVSDCEPKTFDPLKYPHQKRKLD